MPDSAVRAGTNVNKFPRGKIIYSGGYIPDLAIITHPDSLRGWLCYQRPDLSGWVTLCDLGPYVGILLHYDSEEGETEELGGETRSGSDSGPAR